MRYEGSMDDIGLAGLGHGVHKRVVNLGREGRTCPRANVRCTACTFCAFVKSIMPELGITDGQRVLVSQSSARSRGKEK